MPSLIFKENMYLTSKSDTGIKKVLAALSTCFTFRKQVIWKLVSKRDVLLAIRILSHLNQRYM